MPQLRRGQWWFECDGPLCLNCEPPDAQEMAEVMTRADEWIGSARLHLMSKVVEFTFVRGAFRYWDTVQPSSIPTARS